MQQASVSIGACAFGPVACPAVSRTGLPLTGAPQSRGTCSARSVAVLRCSLSRRSSHIVAAAVPEAASTQAKQTSHGHGHGHMMMAKDTGFVAEMRTVAMKLHTKEQAPKEGQAERKAEEKPIPQWKPTKEGYLRFLVESREVYDTMERLAQDESPVYSKFRNTGLERAEALSRDIAWFESMGVKAEPASGAGLEYAKYLKDLASRDPPSFICHFYNVYFAHTAGGRMIGKKVSEMILDGHILDFYKWDGSLEDHMTAVKKSLNEVAEGWSKDEKDRCLKETELSFKYSGALLRYVAA